MRCLSRYSLEVKTADASRRRLLNEDELVAMIFLLIFAGYETTVHLITNAVLTLLQHLEQMEKLRANPELGNSAVEEVMRFRGPVHGTKPNYATEDVEMHGVTIKKGSMVIPLLGAANRDPRMFDNPEVFDIERSPNKHLGFGYGIHLCLGAWLARLETRVAINTLLQRNPNLQVMPNRSNESPCPVRGPSTVPRSGVQTERASR